MSTPLSMEWSLITQGNEQRVYSNDNLFQVVFDGYKLFPMNEKLDVRRTRKSDQIGTGMIEEIVLKDNTTICKYRLISLYSVN
ncbi:DUF2584 family protein [Halobacillus amylolyticus]|uniref:DUF2584 domain-containing protein n=1 Tax=Halobacillus amylolyticus TaxID=2932259 RepID=A0ABY4HCS4_9BACI|nr:DUF2584 family protein [Halobacillus amylolyticus]UOR12524.1 DUF2584 domain-containing protein [Halobacillus amylolyticus]